VSNTVQYRQGILYIILGTNGTGKTTFVEKLCKANWNKNKQRTLVIDDDGSTPQWRHYEKVDVANREQMASFTGIKVAHFIDHEEDTIKYLLENYRDGMIVLDDCSNYAMPWFDKYMNKVLNKRRHYLWDIVAVAHGFDEVPHRFWNKYSKLLLFATYKRMTPYMKRVLWNEAGINQAQDRVIKQFQAAVKKNDSTQYGIFEAISPTDNGSMSL